MSLQRAPDALGHGPTWHRNECIYFRCFCVSQTPPIRSANLFMLSTHHGSNCVIQWFRIKNPSFIAVSQEVRKKTGGIQRRGSQVASVMGFRSMFKSFLHHTHHDAFLSSICFFCYHLRPLPLAFYQSSNKSQTFEHVNVFFGKKSYWSIVGTSNSDHVFHNILYQDGTTMPNKNPWDPNKSQPKYTGAPWIPKFTSL